VLLDPANIQLAHQDMDSLSCQITQKLIQTYLGDELQRIARSKTSKNSSLTASVTSLKSYIDKFEKCHAANILGKSSIVRELYLLHQTVKGLEDFNHSTLNLSNLKYKQKVLYPNIIYLLMRLCPNAKNFLQSNIRLVYQQFKKSSADLVKVHTSCLDVDEDVIKSDILYKFLSDGLKKYNPLNVDNVNAFYRNAFKYYFNFFFKGNQKYSSCVVSLFDIEDSMDGFSNSPTRLSIYKDVSYALQVEKLYSDSPTLSQISYNFNIFRNVIIPNELQSVYFSRKKDSFTLNDDEYKLVKFYNEDISEDTIIEEIKKLPSIYKLLKCVHIASPKTKAYNEMLIKPEMVRNAVLEELCYPFRNFFSDSYMHEILDKIADNFTKNILSGEYINLLTLTSVKINQISFIQQIKKFVRLCLTPEVVCGCNKS
jgi:hypothetical protein